MNSSDIFNCLQKLNQQASEAPPGIYRIVATQSEEKIIAMRIAYMGGEGYVRPSKAIIRFAIEDSPMSAENLSATDAASVYRSELAKMGPAFIDKLNDFLEAYTLAGCAELPSFKPS